MTHIIKAKNIIFRYNKHLVLNNVSLNIKQGELISIIGPNGSGKSTLIKHFNGILLPENGQISVLGYDVKDNFNLFNIRKNIAMVFQNPETQIVTTIVEEEIAFALENLGYPPDEINKRIDYALNFVDMFKYKKHSTYQLSGGQKQRIAIASAVAMKPKCIILDEATSMLDPFGRTAILNLIIMLSRKLDITVIFVTHFMDEACLADRLIVMENGQIIMDNLPSNVFYNIDKLIKIGLELPKTTELCYQLKNNGFNIQHPVMSIDQACCNIKSIINEN